MLKLHKLVTVCADIVNLILVIIFSDSVTAFLEKLLSSVAINNYTFVLIRCVKP